MAGISEAARAASARIKHRYLRLGHGKHDTPQVREQVIRAMTAEGATRRDCAELFGCSDQLVQQILAGRFHMYVTAEEARMIRAFRDHREEKSREARGG